MLFVGGITNKNSRAWVLNSSFLRKENYLKTDRSLGNDYTNFVSLAKPAVFVARVPQERMRILGKVRKPLAGPRNFLTSR